MILSSSILFFDLIEIKIQMQFLSMSSELYASQLFLELKCSYDERCRELAASFTLAVQKIEESEILKEMRGEDLRDFRLQHIVEISKQVLANEQEMQMERHMRTISELKAQLAVERKKFELMGMRSGEQDSKCGKRESKALDDELVTLKKQLLDKDLNPETIASKEMKQIRVETLKVETLEDSKNSFGKTLNKEEIRSQQTSSMTDKYEQVLRLEKKKFEQSNKEMSDKFEAAVSSLKSENENLKSINSRLNEENQHLLDKLAHAAVISPITAVTPLHLTPMKQSIQYESDKQIQNFNDFKLDHFVPRLKKEQSYSYLIDAENVKEKQIERAEMEQRNRTPNRNQEYQGQKGNYQFDGYPNIMRPSSSVVRTRINRETLSFSNQVNEHFQKLNTQPSKDQILSSPSPRWPATTVTTKFEEIKHSFAKQLSDLRAKMNNNRQNLRSPLMRRYVPDGLRYRQSPGHRVVQSPPRHRTQIRGYY